MVETVEFIMNNNYNNEKQVLHIIKLNNAYVGTNNQRKIGNLYNINFKQLEPNLRTFC